MWEVPCPSFPSKATTGVRVQGRNAVSTSDPVREGQSQDVSPAAWSWHLHSVQRNRTGFHSTPEMLTHSGEDDEIVGVGDGRDEWVGRSGELSGLGDQSALCAIGKGKGWKCAEK